jgi:hypothetical protein
MKKYFVPVLVFMGAFFLFTRIAHAQIVINEIMYDLPGTDTDHEWVEVYNDGSLPVTVLGGSGNGKWRFNDGASHLLSATAASGSMTIPAGGYAVFAGNASVFLSDHSGFSGTVIDTTMSLLNTGGTLKVLDENGAELDSVTYSSGNGATGDGHSLQNTGSNWISATPTPGEENATTGAPSDTDTSDDTGNEPLTDAAGTVVYKISSKIVAKTKVVAGIPVSFSAVTLGDDHLTAYKGRWSWNFGDGTSLEYLKDAGIFTHTFSYPGDYAVTLEYSDNFFGLPAPSATDRIIISVLSPKVVISNISYDDKGGIEISNTSSIDMDLSGWKLGSGQTSFIFPKNSILLAGKKVTFAGKQLGLEIKTGQAVALFYPDSMIASAFPKQEIIASPVIVHSSHVKIVESDTTKEETPVYEPTLIPVAAPTNEVTDELEASAGSAGLPPVSKNNLAPIGEFAGITVAGAFLAVFMRRKKARAEMSLADEFTIVE